jgi:hypothetical protein
MQARWGRARWTLPAVVAALLAAPLLPSTAASDVNGSGKFWPFHKTPVTISFGDNLSQPWEDYLQTAITQWRKSDVVRPKISRGTTTGAQCDKKDGTVQVCNGDYGTSVGWLGLTTLDFTGDKITAATIKLNDSFFDQQHYDDPVAKRHTMCHEMGHAFGLDHVATDSCMNDSDQAIFHDDQPIKRDFKTLEQIYSKKNAKASQLTTAGETTGVLALPQTAFAETVTSERRSDGTIQVTYATWAAPTVASR